jgi:hypothetical protein
MSTLTRKEFFGMLFGVAGIATLAAACGGDDGGSADAAGSLGNCVQNGTSVTIASNHGHVLTVSKEDVAAAADKTYDIMGSATHTHSVTVTAANFATLKNNQSINVTSTTGAAHTHNVTVVCA